MPGDVTAENAPNAGEFARFTGGTTIEGRTPAEARADLDLEIGVDVQAFDGDLAAIAALAADGLLARTGAGTAAARTITGAAAGITVTNGDGVAGNPALALANDLGAVEGLSSTGFAVRTTTDVWAQRTIAGTSGKITVTNGDGVSGNPTLNVGADIAQLATEDQVLAGGARVTEKALGTVSSGTTTPDPGDRPIQNLTNNGAFTLAPGANVGAYLLDITNGASAGAITTSGWTKVVGDSFTTTNGHKFRCHCSIAAAGSLLIVQALQ